MRWQKCDSFHLDIDFPASLLTSSHPLVHAGYVCVTCALTSTIKTEKINALVFSLGDNYAFITA